jgi:transcription antitermination factor NusG
LPNAAALGARFKSKEQFRVYSSSSSSSSVQPTAQPELVPWFAIRVKSNFEKRVALSLSSKGLDTFLPEYRTQRRWSDRFKTIDCPLFPGYVFCRIDLNHRMPILSTPGFLCIVSSGAKPAPIDEIEIAGIQEVVGSGLSAQPWPTLLVGQRIRLVRGPLSGLEGTLLEVGRNKRIYVGVTLLRRGLSVEVNSDWILPVSLPQAGINAVAQRFTAVPRQESIVGRDNA